MKNSKHSMKLFKILGLASIGLTQLMLTSCSNPLKNENDWAMNKGASATHIPIEVSQKCYR